VSSSSLRPILNLEIPDLAAMAWTEVVPRAWRRSGEIDKQRLNFPEITDQYHDDYQLLHRFEYEHFYSGWVGIAFRFGACAAHNQNFTEAFKRTGGTSQGIDLYREDDALFDFFVKGLSALESFYYSLYALGALIYTPTQTPSVPPPTQFPLLDPAELLDPAKPKKLRQIKPERVKDTFKEILTLLANGICRRSSILVGWSSERTKPGKRAITKEFLCHCNLIAFLPFPKKPPV
jgi:hypothetical protein